jgi:hypothetical protein
MTVCLAAACARRVQVPTENEHAPADIRAQAALLPKTRDGAQGNSQVRGRLRK